MEKKNGETKTALCKVCKKKWKFDKKMPVSYRRASKLSNILISFYTLLICIRFLKRY